MKPIIYTEGDVLDVLYGKGRVQGLVHVVNDAGRWGAGFTAALDRWEPQLREDYLREPMRLGEVRAAHVEHYRHSCKTTVFHVCAMNGVRRAGVPRPLSYAALARGLRSVGKAWSLIHPEANIYMPRIGCGLAGGTWDQVEPLIVKALCARDIQVVVCDLPPKAA